MRGFILFLVVGMHGLGTAQDLTEADIHESILFEKLEHPYLLFNKQDRAEILFRINNDSESNRIMTELLAEAKMLLLKPIDPTIPARTSNVRAGWTKEDRNRAYGDKLNEYMRHATQLAFVYQITQEKKYAIKSYAFAEVVCKMPVWTIQAHEFDIIYSRVWPWNVEDDQVNFNVDIGSASKGQSMAWVYDWIYDTMTKSQKDRIKGALLEKVITPVRGDYDFHWWASSYRCNWTGVCNGGVGMAAMALIMDYPQLSDVIAESHNRIYRMFDELGVDGGWQEGGGYWRYGMDRSILFAKALNNITDDKFNLFKHDKLKSNPVNFPLYLFVPPNRSVSFGDSGDKRIGGTDFFNLLVEETKNPQGAWYRQQVLGRARDYLDLIFPRPSVIPEPPLETSKLFRSINWWVMRSDFVNPDHVTVAGKAGKNDDPHHGHLDIGHVVLFWKGLDYLKDSGKPYYDEKYFDELRWEYPQAASAGHNTILVNGEQQVSGKLKDQPFNYTIGGEIVTFSTTAERDYVWMDPTNAYSGKELKKWHRHVVLEKPNVTLIVDEIEAQSDQSKMELRFHSAAETIIKENYILLVGEHGTMAMYPISTEELTITSGQHAYQPIHGDMPFEWLPYLNIECIPNGNTATVATLIVPIENNEEAKQILKMIAQTDDSNHIQLSYRGKKYTFLKNDIGRISTRID